MGSPRENWNCIFSDLQLLDERLEQLGLPAIIESDIHTYKKPDLDSITDEKNSQPDVGGVQHV